MKKNAGNSNRQPVAVLKPLPVAVFEITEAEHGLAEYLEVDLDVNTEVLAARVKEDAGNMLLTEIRMGLRIMAMKSKVEHGEFEALLADIGIAERGARKAMQTSRAFAAVGDARRREQILALGKTKGVALLLTKPEVRDQILNDPDLSREAMEASKLELQRLLKDKETQIERHQKSYADLEEQLEGKELELRKLSRVDPAALLTRSIRAEAVAEAAAIGECCDNLARLWESAITEPAKTAAEQDMRQRTVMMSVSAGIASLQAIYDRIKSDSEDGIPIIPGAMDDLTQEERQRAVECFERVRMQFVLRREQRREEAYTEHLANGGQKKRGRPAKTQGSK